MVRTYYVKTGEPYYLPDYGPPVRWTSAVSLDPSDRDSPIASYYECDAENLCSRAINVDKDGKVILAYPGGNHGHWLPDQKIPPEGTQEIRGLYLREMPHSEFDVLWAALRPAYERQFSDADRD
jgi:hypothetical protein